MVSLLIASVARRKKYRKMKHTFEEKMRESNSLFREEQKAMELARRLQEQNEWVTLFTIIQKSAFANVSTVNYSTYFSTSTSPTVYHHIYATTFAHPLPMPLQSQRLSLTSHLAIRLTSNRLFRRCRKQRKNLPPDK